LGFEDAAKKSCRFSCCDALSPRNELIKESVRSKGMDSRHSVSFLEQGEIAQILIFSFKVFLLF
jgi:hypothetical protein